MTFLRRIIGAGLLIPAFFWTSNCLSEEESYSQEKPLEGTYFYMEPVDLLLDSAGEHLFVLTSGEYGLTEYPLGTAGKIKKLPLERRPERMTWFPDKKHLAVVAGSAAGVLYIIDTEKMTLEQTISVGHTPSDVAVFGRTAWVSNRFDGTISVIDLDTGKETVKWDAGREPIALDISRDGKILVAANHIPEERSVGERASGNVRIFNTETGEMKRVRLPVAVYHLKDAVLDPDGNFAFLTCLVGHPEHRLSSVTGGWMNENMLAVVDVRTGKFVVNFSLDGPATLGAGNPRGLAVSEDGRFLAVAGSGTDEVHVFNLPRILHGLTDYSKRAFVFKDNPMRASFPLRFRVPVAGKGVRRVAVHQNTVFSTAYFSDLISRIDMEIEEPVIYEESHDPWTDHTPPEPADFGKSGALTFVPLDTYTPFQGLHLHRSAARLGPKPLWTLSRRGEVLFHDALICDRYWQSCESCHPDARTDALNWDLLNDGFLNPKNTRSLLLSHETPPCMASGVRKDAETAVRAGVTHILFSELSEDDYLAIDEYLKRLQPVPSPYLTAGNLSQSAERGRKLFESSGTGCANCHPVPYFTDFELHDVGTRSYRTGDITIDDFFDKYDTPTLQEVWRTAPYLHDGRYLTVRELITEGNHYAPDDRLKKLTGQEIDDLVEYVLSL
jgi:DNA-binding beta-propeller fold protein YncE